MSAGKARLAEVRDAERAVLGAALLDPDAARIAAELLTAEDFAEERHGVIFGAVCALIEAGAGPDLVTVTARLRKEKQLRRAGGASYLSELVDVVPDVANVERYGSIVHQAAAHRRAVQAMRKVAVAPGADPGAVAEAQERLQELLRADAGGLRTINAEDLFDLDIAPLCWTVEGLLPAGLVLLAGRAKAGKSWLTLSLALAVAGGRSALGAFPAPGGRVLLAALEDGPRRVRDRLAQLLPSGEAPPARLEIVFDLPKLGEGLEPLLDGWLARGDGGGLVILDTLGRCLPGDGGRSKDLYRQAVSELAALQRLATERDASIVAVTHLRKSIAADPLDQVVGSVGGPATADAILLLSRGRGKADGELAVIGRDLPRDRRLAIRFDSGGWRLLGDAEEVELSETRRAILAALRDAGELHYRDLADLLGQTLGGIRATLHKMRRAGQVESCGQGAFRLPQKPETAETRETVSPVSAVSTVSPVSGFSLFQESDSDDELEPSPW